MFVYIRIRQECTPFNPVVPFLGIILRTQSEIHTQIYVQECHHGIVCNCSNWKWSKLPTVRILAQYSVYIITMEQYSALKNHVLKDCVL